MEKSTKHYNNRDILMEKWFKGNIHCHTTNSDGGATPMDLVRYYKEAGFDFVSITDHNHITYQKETGFSAQEILVIPGSEYTRTAKLPEAKVPTQTHVNGIGLSQEFQFKKRAMTTVEESLQFDVNQVDAQGGFSVLNHPNWKWSFGMEEILAIKNVDAFEIFNGSWDANNEGTPNRPSMEKIWDELLSQGKRIWAVAADDCHFLPDPSVPVKYTPATGWIHVEGESLTTESVLQALKEGRFYASTGIELHSINLSPDRIGLTIKPAAQVEFYTTYIGKNGKTLAVEEGLNSSYDIKGNEGYIRIRVNCSGMERAWTQPLFLD